MDAKRVKSVALLGGPAGLSFQAASGGVSIRLPEIPAALMTQPAWVLKIQ